MNLAAAPTPNLPLERVSASSLSQFIWCPEAFRQKYILGIKEKMFGQRFMGSADHETCAEVLRLMMMGDEVTAEHVARIYRDTWARLLDEDGEPDWKDKDPSEMYLRGLQMSVAYFTEVVPNINPVAVEQRLEMTLPDLPKLVGYADIIEKDKIRERKTSDVKRVKPKSGWRFQARIYQLMTGLPVQWDVVTRQVTTKIYTADDNPELRMEVVEQETTVTMIRNIVSRMAHMMDTHGPDNPWPTDGYFGDYKCSYCAIGPDHLSLCPAWR